MFMDQPEVKADNFYIDSSKIITFVRTKLQVFESLKDVILQSNPDQEISFADIEMVLQQFNTIKHIICCCSTTDTTELRINLRLFFELLTEMKQRLFIQK